MRPIIGRMEAKPPALPDQLGLSPGAVTTVLFSQVGCAFCAIVREHYLQPLAAAKPARIRVAEVELGSRRKLVNWQKQLVTHADFARSYDVRFAPTVMFLDARGRELSARIVGLSEDYFGAYLEAGIAAALAAEQ